MSGDDDVAHGLADEAVRTVPPDDPQDLIAITSTRVVNSALWSALLSLLSAPVLAATTILLARALGVADFGRYAFYTYAIALVTGLGDLGIGTALVRAGALAAGRGDVDELMRYVRGGTTWSLVQIPWAIGVAWFVLPSTTAVALFALAVLVAFPVLGPSHYLVMTSDLRRSSQIRTVALGLNVVGWLVAAWVTHDPAITFAAGMLGANVLTVLQIVAVPRDLRRATLRPGRLQLSRHDLGFGVGTLMNAQLGGFVFSRSEVLFFRKSQDRPLGTFAAAQTLSARASLVFDVFFGSIPAAMAAAAGRGEDALHRAFDRVTGAAVFLFALTAPAVAVAVVCAGPPLFGHGFEAMAMPAVILTIVSLVQSTMHPLFSLRFAQRSIVPLIVSGALAASVDAALSALLIPHHGVAGAVVASGVSAGVYLFGVAASYVRGSEWRRPIAHFAGRIGLVALVVAGVSIPLVTLSTASAIALGAPLALIVSLALLRLPGVRLNSDAREIVVGTLPVRVRVPADRTFRLLSGGRS